MKKKIFLTITFHFRKIYNLLTISSAAILSVCYLTSWDIGVELVVSFVKTHQITNITNDKMIKGWILQRVLQHGEKGAGVVRDGLRQIVRD